MSERVAIITRTRNRPELLRRSVASVVAQTFGDWRQYVVNDAGVPGPVEAAIDAAAPRSRERVELLHLPSRVGMEAATNTVLKRISARWVVLLDDDDTWSPNFLGTAVRALEKPSSPTVRGVVTRSVVVEERLDEAGPVELARRDFNGELEALSLEQLARGNQFTNNAFLFEREALAVVGTYCEDLPVYGDWDFNLRFLQAFDVDVVPQALACYHRRVAAEGEQRNSFAQDPAVAARARARFTNLWLRGREGRSPQIGTLIALGPFVTEQEDLRQRVDKYLNAFHRLRRLPLLRSLDGALFGRSR